MDTVIYSYIWQNTMILCRYAYMHVYLELLLHTSVYANLYTCPCAYMCVRCICICILADLIFLYLKFASAIENRFFLCYFVNTYAAVVMQNTHIHNSWTGFCVQQRNARQNCRNIMWGRVERQDKINTDLTFVAG